MSRWFRTYDEALNDPKLQRLPAERFKAWFNLLCVASANNGIFPSVEELAFALRVSEEIMQGHLDALLDAGLIDVDFETGTVSPHNWKSRQFQSDASTERVKRFRNGKRNVSETAPDTDTDTEKKDITDVSTSDAVVRIEREKKKRAEELSALHLLGSDWNSLAADCRLAQIDEIKPTSPREKSALARIRECAPMATAFTKIRGSPFLRGDTSDFRVSFDWIINPTNLAKVLEGNYDEVRQTQYRYAQHR